jgi:hypothetical protein
MHSSVLRLSTTCFATILWCCIDHPQAASAQQSSGPDRKTIERRNAFKIIATERLRDISVQRSAAAWIANKKALDRLNVLMPPGPAVNPKTGVEYQRDNWLESAVITKLNQWAYEGFNPESEVAVRLINAAGGGALTPLLPDVMEKLIPKRDIYAYSPRFYASHLDEMFDEIEKKSQMGNLIAESLSEAQWDPRQPGTFQDHRAVIAVNNERLRLSQIKATRQARDVERKMLKQIGHLLETQASDAASQLRTTNESDEYRRRYGEIVGSLRATGHALNLIGNDELASTALGVADIAQTLASLSDPKNELGPFGLASGYLGAAVMVKNLFARGTRGTDPVAVMMLKALDNFRKEISGRFDRVDRKLDDLTGIALTTLSTLQQTRIENAERGSRLSLQLDSLGYAVADLTRRVSRTDEAFVREKCIGTFGKVVQPLADAGVDECVRYFALSAADLAYDRSAAGLDLLAPSADNTAFMHASTIQTLISQLRQVRSSEVSAVASTQDTTAALTTSRPLDGAIVPNPLLWLHNSLGLLLFASQDSGRLRARHTGYLTRMITAGRAIENAYAELAGTDSGRAARNIASLANVMRRSATALDRMVDSARRNRQLNPRIPYAALGTWRSDLKKYVPSYFLGSSRPRLQWCDEKQDFSLTLARSERVRLGHVPRDSTVQEQVDAARSVESAFDKNGRFNWRGTGLPEPVGQGHVDLDQQVADLVDPRLKLAEVMGFGVVTACLKRHTLSEVVLRSQNQGCSPSMAFETALEFGLSWTDSLDKRRVGFKRFAVQSLSTTGSTNYWHDYMKDRDEPGPELRTAWIWHKDSGRNPLCTNLTVSAALVDPSRFRVDYLLKDSPEWRRIFEGRVSTRLDQEGEDVVALLRIGNVSYSQLTNEIRRSELTAAAVREAFLRARYNSRTEATRECLAIESFPLLRSDKIERRLSRGLAAASLYAADEYSLTSAFSKCREQVGVIARDLLGITQTRMALEELLSTVKLNIGYLQIVWN